jgi:hypothetical protein
MWQPSCGRSDCKQYHCCREMGTEVKKSHSPPPHSLKKIVFQSHRLTGARQVI